MKLKTFHVPVKFTFAGHFKIKARNANEAAIFADTHCGLVLGRGVHSSLPDETVDWDFPVFPKKEVNYEMTHS